MKFSYMFQAFSVATNAYFSHLNLIPIHFSATKNISTIQRLLLKIAMFLIYF